VVRIVQDETILTGYLNVRRLKIERDGGIVSTLEVESHGEAVALLPYDAGRRCALTVRLFRAPVFVVSGDAYLEEACAGMIDAGEDAAQAVRREAGEELGLECRAPLEPLGRVWSSAGVSTERVSLFLVRYSAAERSGPGGGAVGENEGITVVERSLRSLLADVENARIPDHKLLTLVLGLRLRHPELFDEDVRPWRAIMS
jgi:nudix-type nucleoside diphosphatase (YffH/AdpP family)